MRRWLPRLAYDHPVTVLMGFIALLVVGLIAYVRVPMQLMPSGFEPAQMWVSLAYPNGSPRETDEQVVRPIEAQLGTLSELKSVRSRASSGRATFSLEFHSSADMDSAYADVVDRIERAMPDLPDEVDRYFVYKFNPDDMPILWVGVTIPDDVVDKHHLVERVVRPSIERLPGVASVDTWGIDPNVVFIDYDRQQVAAHGVNLSAIHSALAGDNFQGSAGVLLDRGQRRHVRSLARWEDIDTLRTYPIGEGLVLSDVADVSVSAARDLDINRVNGRDAAGLVVRKESAANTVEVSRAVVGTLDELAADPRLEGVSFFVFFNQGEVIEESVDTLRNTLLTGGAFALVILFLFLREWRMTLLIAASIPFSLLITVGVLYFRGDSLNLLSLMGLMLAVGMVVDNAIVVIETIYRRRAEGDGLREAAIAGTAEVNVAILLSTLTTMVVFLPIILMSRDATLSFFLGSLGLPVVFALGASLVVALAFAPLATRFMGAAQIKPDPRWMVWLIDLYARSLAWFLRRRTDALILIVVLGVVTWIIPVSHVHMSDSAEGNLNDFALRFQVPAQADHAERDAIVRAFEAVFDEHFEAWGLRAYRAELRDGSRKGELEVYIQEDGPLTRDEVMDAAQEELPDDLPGVTCDMGWQDRSGGGGNSLEITLRGEDTATLEALADEVIRRLETTEGVIAARTTDELGGNDELRLRVRRQDLDRYGISAMQAAQTVAYAMRGSSFQPLVSGESEIEVQARFRGEDRGSMEALRSFSLWTADGGVPLRAVTDVEVGKGPRSIRRTDHRTSLGIHLDLEDEVDLTVAGAAVDAALSGMVFPRGYTWDKGDRFDMQLEDTQALQLAMVLSIVFVFLIMGVLFESFLKPLAVVTTIPMAMLGAYWGLYVTGTAMDTMAMVGLVILVGVVVNNGIVLIDLVTQLRARGVPRDEALVEAGRRRLRPILMTALTTIAGLIPMALGASSFIGIPYAPLGRTVIGGLTAATLLTLVLVPYLYALLDDLHAGLIAWVGFVRARRSA